jgi:DNA-binding transcriptional LysR family regulator
MNTLLELRHLRYFVAVAEELHFTRAAERVFLTQPALSQQIKALEEIVGVPLIDRTQRKIRLTDAGQILLHGARRTLNEADRSIHESRRAGVSARLSLGYIEYAFQSFANPIIQSLLKRCSPLRIERREVAQDAIPQALQDHVIDLGIAMLPMEGTNISSCDITRGRWQIVMPAEHPLTRESTIPLASLAGEPLLMFSRTVNPSLYDFVLNRFRRAGVEPNVVYETSQGDAGQNMVELGVGLWIVASYVIGARLPKRLVARDLAEFDEIRVGLAWRTDDTSKHLEAALNAIQEQLSG